MTPPITPPAVRPDYQLVGPMEDDASSPTSPIQLRRLVPFLLKYWWLPVLTLVLSLGAAYGYVKRIKGPTYVSKAQMWDTEKLRLPDGNLFSEDAQNFLGTQTELLQSPTLRQLALDRMRSYSNNAALPTGKDGKPLPVNVSLKGNSKSSVFAIEAASSLQGYTRDYLDALLDAYLEYKKIARDKIGQNTMTSITLQVERMGRELRDKQDLLSAFQRTNNLAILEEEGRASGGYLTRLKTQLSDLQLESRLLMATASNPPPPLPVETNASLAVVPASTGPGYSLSAGAQPENQTAFREMELLKLQRARLSRYLRPKHPKIVKLDADIERAEKLIDIFQRQSRDQLAASRSAIQMKIDNVQDSINDWKSKVASSRDRLADGERLKLAVSRAQDVYDKYSMLVDAVGVKKNIELETVAILASASPAERSRFEEFVLYGVASAGGLGLGLAIILLLVLRDDRFTSFAEINERLGENVVGQVPEVLGLKPAGSLPLLEGDDQRHAYAESFRSLRSALIFMAIESERPRVVLITSAQPHEGKSTVAANLARALALGGSRVVLVDADLRRGILHERLGLQREPGLAEVLREPVRLEKAIQTNSLSNLAFIASGRVVGNCGDVFLGPAFDQVLARLREQYDYVVIDSSPVLAADDASTLAPKVDGTLFVVRSRHSHAGPVREALGLLYQRNARVLGVILNQTDSSSRSNYYYKYAEYHAPARTT